MLFCLLESYIFTLYSLIGSHFYFDIFILKKIVYYHPKQKNNS